MLYTVFGIVIAVCTVVSGNEVENLEVRREINSYSSFQCVGGSQVFNSESLIQASVKVFPLNNPEFRTCLYKNVCFVNGAFTFFQRNSSVPKDYLPEGFKDGNVNHLAYLRAFTVPVKTVTGKISKDYKYSPVDLTFLDANSWSFNYGHYLNDNIIPTYFASKLFNLPFGNNTQQLFETNCRLFSILEEGFSNKIVTYNHSMGTYRKGCLEKIDLMWDHFYDHRPLYLDDMQQSTLCFRKLITGQGSSFGLKSVDLSRSVLMRDFRDYVLRRLQTKLHALAPAASTNNAPVTGKDNIILVGQRTVGAAGGDLIHDLCHQVTHSLSQIPQYKDLYQVKCIVPSDLSFESEINEAQHAKVIITVHGTISYLSYFSRDGTQQISISNPKELKENQMLLYITHVNAMYLNWDRMHDLTGVLTHALDNSEAHYYGNN